MVEDPKFWEDNNVGLAVSGNAGFINGDRGPWFNYPAGCLAMNVPITSAERVVPAMMAAMPVIVGTLAVGRNTAFHCINCAHRGPLLALFFLMVVHPGRSAASEPSTDRREGSGRTVRRAAQARAGVSRQR